MFDFTGKIAVVTGGGSGIGKETAFAFAYQGAAVAIIDINAPVASDLPRMKAILQERGRGDYYAGDVARPDEMEAVITTIGKSHGGRIDFLITCAGVEINDRGSIVDMDLADLRRIMDVDFWGTVHCVRAAVPFMPRGGSIVLVSSVQAFIVDRPVTSYQPAKAAVDALGRGLALELAPRGIRVNVLAPGAIAEGMGAGRSKEEIRRLQRKIPMGRRGGAQEVAEAIMYLCSDASSYVTGETHRVDGGLFVNNTVDMADLLNLPVPDDPDSR